jgi:hypothetical protein
MLKELITPLAGRFFWYRPAWCSSICNPNLRLRSAYRINAGSISPSAATTFNRKKLGAFFAALIIDETKTIFASIESHS